MSRHPRVRDERGFAAGSEMVVLGVVVTFSLLALITTAWATLDRHMTLDMAAHEYMRAYTSGITHERGHEAGLSAAIQTIAERGVNPHDLQITPSDPTAFGPCASVSVEFDLRAPVLHLPFFSSVGWRDLSVSQHGLVDPHRTSFPGARYESLATICADY